MMKAKKDMHEAVRKGYVTRLHVEARKPARKGKR